MCPPWGTPLVSPWRISCTPRCPSVSTISGGLYSPCVPLLRVSLLPSVWTLAAAPFQRTGCPYKISGRTTFGHFGQIFRLFLEFGAHERRWRFLYSKTWQLYKVELSFPERYTQFLMNFRQYFSKWSFWTQNQRGYPLPKFDFRPIFHFGMVWGGKCDFGMNLQWIVQCFDEEWIAHNCLSLYHRASVQRRFVMSASMLKCEDFASTYAKGGTDRARSLARVPHMTKGASLSQRTSWHSVTRFASRLERGRPLCKQARKRPGRFASRLKRWPAASKQFHGKFEKSPAITLFF